MMTRSFFMWFASAVLACSSASAEPVVQFRGTSILLSDGGRRYELKELIDAHSFYETLHAVARRGQDYYVVYGSSEMSRGWPPRGGNCGAGIESFVRWLHVRDGKVAAQQEGLYESCQKNRDGWSLRWEGGKLRLSTMGFRSAGGVPAKYVPQELSWVYDAARPELGLVESEMVSEAE